MGKHSARTKSRRLVNRGSASYTAGRQASQIQERVDENLTSDHFTLRIDIQNIKPVTLNSKTIINFKKVANTLNGLDLSQTTDINEFETIIQKSILDNSKTIKINNRFIPKPWWNEHINRLWSIKI